MSTEFVTIERPDGFDDRIAIVRFDRSDGVNAFSGQLMRELTDTAKSFENDGQTSAVILTGSDKVFSMGADLKERGSQSGDPGLMARRLGVQAGPKLCRAWEEIEPLTICAVEGWCIGAGLALAVAFDLRVAGSSARFYAPEIERGMNMSWQSVPRSVNLVGPAKTKRMFALAERVSAADAENWGLIEDVTEDGKALDKALEYAKRAAELPPVQLRMVLQGVKGAANALNNAVSYMDFDQYALAQSSGDYREGVQSFLEKRPPKYTGR